MAETMGLSRVAFENIIFQKTSARLKQIKWGENCHSLISAFTYAEEWLFEGIRGTENKKKMQNYLFSEGFNLKVVKCLGKETVTWMFPSKPKRPLFEKIKRDYTDSYHRAMSIQERKAHDDIVGFSESEECNKAYSLENSFYKKFLQDKLGAYNQELLRSKNTSEEEMRDYISSRITRHGDAIFLTKNGNFYGWIEQAESVHDMAFDNSFKLLKLIIKSMIDSRAFSKVPSKYVIGVLPSHVEEFKKALEYHNILASLMPNYPEKEYFTIKNAAEYEVMLYLEVVNADENDDGCHVQSLQKLCDVTTR